MAHILATSMSEVVEAWADEANRAAAAHGLSRPELMSLMPLYLSSLARAGEPAQGEQLALIESHLSTRLRAGFNLAEVLEEFAILQRVINGVLSGLRPEDRPGLDEIDRLSAEIQAAMTAVGRAFRQYMEEDEQTERRYLRLLHVPFAGPYDEDPPLSHARLMRVLGVVMEAMAADTAALLLHDPETRELVMAASAGQAEEPLAQYARSLDPSSFVGTVAGSGRAIEMHDVATTPLDVSDTLRQSGVHALLGVRLPQHHVLLGVLYIGLREHRAFSAREVRRIEALGERLSLHLDNARLYAELRERIEALHAERRLREQFVATLAHDLRGPLSSAKMAADLLAKATPQGEPLASSHRMIEIVRRNLARADRMVSDLLDVERLGAGEQLVLHLEEADLGAIARDVVDELKAEHPRRLELHAEEGVRGVWGAPELRRALWNLVSNALKYGATDTPVAVVVARHPGGAEVRVHNEGAPIPAAEQATLFEPFIRAESARSTKGWGLGLALVRGCAEAHGGSVHVDSAPGRGTTFTLRLPPDARPPSRPGVLTPPARGP